MNARSNVRHWIEFLTSDRGQRAEMAKSLGVSKQAVSNWVNGESAPDIETLVELSQRYRIPLNDLLTTSPDASMNRDNELKPSFEEKEVPLYGKIAAGTPIEMIEVEGHHVIPRSIADSYPDAFLLKVEGDSMNRILPNGSYALIDPCSDVERDNQPYAVCVNGFDATVKRVHKLNNGFELVPDSTDPTFKPVIYDYGVEGTETITIIGRVVYYVLPFDWSF